MLYRGDAMARSAVGDLLSVNGFIIIVLAVTDSETICADLDTWRYFFSVNNLGLPSSYTVLWCSCDEIL